MSECKKIWKVEYVLHCPNEYTGDAYIPQSKLICAPSAAAIIRAHPYATLVELIGSISEVIHE